MLQKCTTLKPDHECLFMKKDHCTFGEGFCHPIIDSCLGPECEHVQTINDVKYCDAYAYPANKWKWGDCPLATNLKKVEEEKKSPVVQRKFKKKR